MGQKWGKRALVWMLSIVIGVLIINAKYAEFFDGRIVSGSHIKHKSSWRATKSAEENTLITGASTNRSAARKTKFCDGFPEDIVIFDKSKNDTSFCCDVCVIVSSSGNMAGSLAGSDIESKECIIRMNNAPTQGYESDVGSRTTFRVFGHSSIVDVRKLLPSHISEENSTIFVAWGPIGTKVPGTETYDKLKVMSEQYPNARIHMFTDARMIKSNKLFNDETGLNKEGNDLYLSTGFFTIQFAKDICREIHIYGMVEENFCEKVSKKELKDFPYHYFEPAGESQCSTYRGHERSPRSAYRFITEKRVFNKWAKEWRNVKFHNPEHNLDL